MTKLTKFETKDVGLQHAAPAKCRRGKETHQWFQCWLVVASHATRAGRMTRIVEEVGKSAAPKQPTRKRPLCAWKCPANQRRRIIKCDHETSAVRSTPPPKPNHFTNLVSVFQSPARRHEFITNERAVLAPQVLDGCLTCRHQDSRVPPRHRV